MIEGLILLLMLGGMFLLMTQAKRLTGTKDATRSIMRIFDFKSSLTTVSKKIEGKF